MWCPESLETPSGKLSFPLPKTSHEFNFLNSQGLMYEAMEVRRCINEGESRIKGFTDLLWIINVEID